MGRWLPDAQGRMMRAAMELYAERGFEQTTAADIADRAGVTERTFFRHFADKREVLFAGSHELQEAIVAAIAAAPSASSPLEMVVAGVVDGTRTLEYERAQARSRIIAANASLQERELLKMAALSAASAEALRARGVPDATAALAGEAGIAIFRTGFDQWVASGGELPDHLRAALAELRAALG